MTEHFRGVGELYEGLMRLGRIRYEVVAQERTQPAPRMGNPGARSPALGLVTGFIEPAEGLDLWPVFERRTELTVILQGGQRWSFYLRGPGGEAMPGKLESEP